MCDVGIPAPTSVSLSLKSPGLINHLLSMENRRSFLGGNISDMSET